MQLDILTFGPHPDDIEIGLGGTLAKHAHLGYRVGLCDLTAGELGSNGTPEQRRVEAQEAAEVIGAVWRKNLGWPDGGIGDDPLQIRTAAEFIRRYRPGTVALPFWSDRHPDHVAASNLLTAAVFRSGLRRYLVAGKPWRPEWVVYYFINDSVPASFVVDVSSEYELKRRALACHKSQFQPVGSDVVSTRLTSSRFIQLVESRDSNMGALAGVDFAEGVVVKEPVLRPNLFKNWASVPMSASGEVVL